nr:MULTISPECIES: effector-associated domain EAD1-containing protein [Pseudofrankia]
MSADEVEAFADAFPERRAAGWVLTAAGLPTRRHPSWTATDAQGF